MRPVEWTDSMTQGSRVPPQQTLPPPCSSPALFPRAGGSYGWGCKKNKSTKVRVQVLGGFLPRSGHAWKRQRWGSSRCRAGTGDKGAQPLLPPVAPSWASRCIDAFLRLPQLGQMQRQTKEHWMQ